MSTESTKKFYGYKVVIGAIIISMLHNGCASVYSTYFLEMAEKAGTDLAGVGYATTISLIVTVVSGTIWGSIRGIEKLGVKNCLYISSVLAGLGYVLMAVAGNVTIIYLGVILIGLNLTIGTAATLSVLVSMWFVEKRSEMLGIVIGGLLLGGTVMVMLASRINAFFGSYTITYFILAGLITIGGILVNLFIIRTPEQMGQKALGWEKEAELSKAEANNTSDIGDAISMASVIKSFSFWALMIAIAAFTFTVDSLAFYIPTFCITYGVDAVRAADYYSMYLFLGFVGSLICGRIDEKLGHKVFIIVLGGLSGIGTLMFAFWPQTGSGIFVVAAVIIAGLGIQCCNTAGPVLAISMFGKRNYGPVCNYASTAQALGAAIIAPVMNICLNVTGGMEAEFIIAAAGTFISILLVLVAMKVSPLAKMMKKA